MSSFFFFLLAKVYANIKGLLSRSNRYSDHRTRRDRTLKTEQGFTDQLEHTTDAYMAWAAAKQSNATHRCAGACSTPQTGIFDPQGSTISLIVVDIFGKTESHLQVRWLIQVTAQLALRYP